METLNQKNTFEILRQLVTSNGSLTKEVLKMIDAQSEEDAPETTSVASTVIPDFANAFVMLQIISSLLLMLLFCCGGFFCGIFSVRFLMPKGKQAKNHFYIVNGKVDAIEQQDQVPAIEAYQPSPPPPYLSESVDTESEAEYEYIDEVFTGVRVETTNL